MSQFVESPTRSFKASAALSQYRLVRTSTSLAYNGAANTDWLGTLDRAALAADEYVPVRLRNAPGTHIMIASEAISAGVAVYAAANGKVQTVTAGTVLVGIALSAATADGDQIEVLASQAAIVGTVARTSLTQDDLAVYNIPLSQLKTWDALGTGLPDAAGTDDLGIITGTVGTDAPVLKGVDAGGTTETQKAGFLFALPPEYVGGQTVTLRINAKMQVVADDTATVDAVVYDLDGPTTDICATAAQSINSATAANKDFTITPTGLAAGDMLYGVITTAVTDAGNAAANINAVINSVEILADIKG